jgi:hypothetical protein
MLGKQAVAKGAQPERILPFRDGVPEEGMYTEAVENDFVETTASASCDTEGLGKILGLDFRLRQPVPDKKMFNARSVLPQTNKQKAC